MPLFRNEIYYCDHIGAFDCDYSDIERFSVKDERGNGLVQYLKYSAQEDESAGRMRTYLVRTNNTDLAGYFSLKAGLISLNESNNAGYNEFDTLPGIELANFAVNNEYQARHPETKGLGLMIFKRLKPRYDSECIFMYQRL